MFLAQACYLSGGVTGSNQIHHWLMGSAPVTDLSCKNLGSQGLGFSCLPCTLQNEFTGKTLS